MNTPSKKQILPSGISTHEIDWSLYVIIDSEWLNKRLVQEIAEKVIKGGASVIQYRDKVSDSRCFFENAAIIRDVTKNHRIPFLINDRVDMALAVASDGVHLGSGDLPLKVARKLMGENTLIGASISEQHHLSQCGEADYLGVGAVFPTETYSTYSVVGLELVRLARKQTELPIVGIGGIHHGNASSVIRAGADGVAIISAILGHDDVEKATRDFTAVLKN